MIMHEIAFLTVTDLSWFNMCLIFLFLGADYHQSLLAKDHIDGKSSLKQKKMVLGSKPPECANKCLGCRNQRKFSDEENTPFKYAKLTQTKRKLLQTISSLNCYIYQFLNAHFTTIES